MEKDIDKSKMVHAASRLDKEDANVDCWPEKLALKGNVKRIPTGWLSINWSTRLPVKNSDC